ncbi:transglutaminase domain-containing protein [Clostridium bovifaecis]|uniref:Transglutaminase domain-containing protein n=1 Tax=Clostridium bovifaecis TaxID=2184719 RepID=A0A6I6F364_9CLOT|nr:transglutaminase domain-containing protein [Clostridium bovifaecis]
MRRKRSTVILIWIVVILMCVTAFKFKNMGDKVGLRIVKWDNFYEGNNVQLYYGSTEKKLLRELRERYNLDEITQNSKDDFDKSLKIMQWINENMNYDSKIEEHLEEKGAFDILADANKKTYSNKEICIVYNEFTTALGIASRIGELTLSKEEKTRGKRSLQVCEVWSSKYNKWIMIDTSNGIYVKYNNIPLSAIEVIEKGIENFEVVGTADSKSYKHEMKKYFYNYIIKIDNSVYDLKKSNSYISFVKDIENISSIPVNENNFRPIIFTNNSSLFTLSPDHSLKDNKKDKVPTFIFSKKSREKHDPEVKEELYGGVFQDSSMIEKYYISINNGPFKLQNKYFDVAIRSGITNIKLSKNGQDVVREVSFEFLE